MCHIPVVYNCRLVVVYKFPVQNIKVTNDTQKANQKTCKETRAALPERHKKCCVVVPHAFRPHVFLSLSWCCVGSSGLFFLRSVVCCHQFGKEGQQQKKGRRVLFFKVQFSLSKRRLLFYKRLSAGWPRAPSCYCAAPIVFSPSSWFGCWRFPEAPGRGEGEEPEPLNQNLKRIITQTKNDEHSGPSCSQP